MITRINHAHAVTPPAPAPKPAATPPSEEQYLHPDVVRSRIEQGRIAEYEEGVLPPSVGPLNAPSYFRSYQDVKHALFDLQAKYPNLVEVRDIGDSSEKATGGADRDVLLLRLTAKGVNDGRKPSAMHIAGEHAREVANPELVLRHALQLLEGYGTDPEATALLQTRVIDIVPMMNPDGHVKIENGYAHVPGGNVMQRKNTSAPSGTDLNRNYEYHWGGSGASPNPSSDTYRGPRAGSEPEVQAIEKHVTDSRPGIFVDWHSYSRLNLFPWGDTHNKAPDYDGLMGLAKKFSSWNGYTPQQSIQLYPTNGTSKDWVYGTYRTPAFTVETGDAFHQTDEQFEETWAQNAPVLMYADKVADAPFQRVLGPDVVDLHVTVPNAPGTGAQQARISAAVSDRTNGGQKLAGAELLRDPFAAPGSGVALQAADGAFDSVNEQVTGVVDAGAGAKQLVYVRAQDEQGNWGPLTAQWIGGTQA